MSDVPIAMPTASQAGLTFAALGILFSTAPLSAASSGGRSEQARCGVPLPAPISADRDYSQNLIAAKLVHRERRGWNNFLIVRAKVPIMPKDEVSLVGHLVQVRTRPLQGAQSITKWRATPRSSNGSGSVLFKQLRDGAGRGCPSLLEGVFKPDGGDVGDVARFEISKYGQTTPAVYPALE